MIRVVGICQNCGESKVLDEWCRCKGCQEDWWHKALFGPDPEYLTDPTSWVILEPKLNVVPGNIPPKPPDDLQPIRGTLAHTQSVNELISEHLKAMRPALRRSWRKYLHT